MTGTWFVSDTHFTHARINELAERPFATVDEMNAAIVENWNRVVKPSDQVWHLGDVGMGQLARFRPLLQRLNGRKHLIAGNHDEVWPGHREAHQHQRTWLQVFDSIQPFARKKICGQRVMLSHFPYWGGGDHTEVERYPDYRLPDTGAWLLHGHTHSTVRVHRRMINVGVEANNYTPVSINEIVRLIEAAPEGY